MATLSQQCVKTIELNEAGFNSYSQSDVDTAPAVANARIKISGIWKNANARIKIAGVWKSARPYVKILGTWKPMV
jgi:hypothetical protein